MRFSMIKKLLLTALMSVCLSTQVVFYWDAVYPQSARQGQDDLPAWKKELLRVAVTLGIDMDEVQKKSQIGVSPEKAVPDQYLYWGAVEEEIKKALISCDAAIRKKLDIYETREWLDQNYREEIEKQMRLIYGEINRIDERKKRAPVDTREHYDTMIRAWHDVIRSLGQAKSGIRYIYPQTLEKLQQLSYPGEKPEIGTRIYDNLRYLNIKRLIAATPALPRLVVVGEEGREQDGTYRWSLTIEGNAPVALYGLHIVIHSESEIVDAELPEYLKEWKRHVRANEIIFRTEEKPIREHEFHWVRAFLLYSNTESITFSYWFTDVKAHRIPGTYGTYPPGAVSEEPVDD